MFVKIKKYHIDPFEIVEIFPEESEKTFKERKIITYRLMLEMKSGSIKGYDFDTADERDDRIKRILFIRNDSKK